MKSLFIHKSISQVKSSSWKPRVSGSGQAKKYSHFEFAFCLLHDCNADRTGFLTKYSECDIYPKGYQDKNSKKSNQGNQGNWGNHENQGNQEHQGNLGRQGNQGNKGNLGNQGIKAIRAIKAI